MPAADKTSASSAKLPTSDVRKRGSAVAFASVWFMLRMLKTAWAGDTDQIACL